MRRKINRGNRRNGHKCKRRSRFLKFRGIFKRLDKSFVKYGLTDDMMAAMLFKRLKKAIYEALLCSDGLRLMLGKDGRKRYFCKTRSSDDMRFLMARQRANNLMITLNDYLRGKRIEDCD